VILTERSGATFPRGKLLVTADSGRFGIYENRFSGMEIAGFESGPYFAFVVSDLNQKELLQLARGLAPALNERLHMTARVLRPTATTKWISSSIDLRVVRPNYQERSLVSAEHLLNKRLQTRTSDLSQNKRRSISTNGSG
jgi:hypothetical protein